MHWVCSLTRKAASALKTCTHERPSARGLGPRLTCSEGQGGGGEPGSIAEIPGDWQVGDGADDGGAIDADGELLAVQLLQQVLTHVLGQRVAIGQSDLSQQPLRLQAKAFCVRCVNLVRVGVQHMPLHA